MHAGRIHYSTTPAFPPNLEFILLVPISSLLLFVGRHVPVYFRVRIPVAWQKDCIYNRYLSVGGIQD